MVRSTRRVREIRKYQVARTNPREHLKDEFLKIGINVVNGKILDECTFSELASALAVIKICEE